MLAATDGTGPSGGMGPKATPPTKDDDGGGLGGLLGGGKR